MADEGGKTFPSPCDTVSQSAPCFSLPNTKSNSDTEYGSEFPMSCLVAIFLIDCTNVLFFFFTRVSIKILGHTVYKTSLNDFRLPETRTHRTYSFESLQMGMGDMVLTRISKVPHAAASHLSNTLDFRKPSDVAFTATLSSGEHPIRRRTQPEVRCTYTWQLNRTLS